MFGFIKYYINNRWWYTNRFTVSLFQGSFFRRSTNYTFSTSYTFWRSCCCFFQKFIKDIKLRYINAFIMKALFDYLLCDSIWENTLSVFRDAQCCSCWVLRDVPTLWTSLSCSCPCPCPCCSFETCCRFVIIFICWRKLEKIDKKSEG